MTNNPTKVEPNGNQPPPGSFEELILNTAGGPIQIKPADRLVKLPHHLKWEHLLEYTEPQVGMPVTITMLRRSGKFIHRSGLVREILRTHKPRAFW